MAIHNSGILSVTYINVQRSIFVLLIVLLYFLLANYESWEHIITAHSYRKTTPLSFNGCTFLWSSGFVNQTRSWSQPPPQSFNLGTVSVLCPHTTSVLCLFTMKNYPGFALTLFPCFDHAPCRAFSKPLSRRFVFGRVFVALLKHYFAAIRWELRPRS